MCTSFLAYKNGSFCITGRSMDYDDPNEKYTTSEYEVGYLFRSVLSEKDVSWISKYGIFTVCSIQSAYNVPFEGINSAGLSISGNTGSAIYPTSNQQTISSDDVVNWVLAQAGTVDEAIYWLSNINIQGPWQMHYIVFDRNGDEAVVEYGGDPVVYRNKTRVLTNQPALNLQLEKQADYGNLKNWYTGAVRPLSRAQFYSQSLKSTSGKSLSDALLSHSHSESHGQGMLGLPGDWTSASRFTKAQITLHFTVPYAEGNADAIRLVKRILEQVSLIKGIDLGDRPNGRPIYTQMQVVKDLASGTVYWRGYDDEAWSRWSFSNPFVLDPPPPVYQ